MELAPIVYFFLKCSVLAVMFLSIVYVPINFILVCCGVHLQSLLGKFYLKKRHAIVIFLASLVLNAVVDGMYHRQIDLYPFDVLIEDITGHWEDKDASLDILNNGTLYFTEHGSQDKQMYNYEIKQGVINIVEVNGHSIDKIAKWKIISFKEKYRIIDYSYFEGIIEDEIGDFGFEKCNSE